MSLDTEIVDKVESLLNQGYHYTQVRNLTGVSVATICKIKKGTYKRKIATIELNKYVELKNRYRELFDRYLMVARQNKRYPKKVEEHVMFRTIDKPTTCKEIIEEVRDILVMELSPKDIREIRFRNGIINGKKLDLK